MKHKRLKGQEEEMAIGGGFLLGQMEVLRAKSSLST